MLWAVALIYQCGGKKEHYVWIECLAVSTDSVRATKLFNYVIDNNDYQ